MAIAKNTICLWYDKDAEAAARFYAGTFPNSSVGAVHRAPSDYPSGKAGDVLMVEFTVAGIPCLGLNGGPTFKHDEAFSFQISTDDQEETDRYWNAIVGNGGQEIGPCPQCDLADTVLYEVLADRGEGGGLAQSTGLHDVGVSRRTAAVGPGWAWRYRPILDERRDPGRYSQYHGPQPNPIPVD
jgi:predicted 3-demethylubiquinone-9 3-methyltransferase (glyoxalase superfamily)